MPTNTGLLIIDVQNCMFDPEPVYKSEELLINLQKLIERARAAQTPVIFVQHNGPEGAPHAPGEPGWEIHPAIAPISDDLIIQKTMPDSFFETTLQEELTKLGIEHLIMTGIQTDYCVDTTCRRASSNGYEVTLVKDAHSTWSNNHITAVLIIDAQVNMFDEEMPIYRTTEVLDNLETLCQNARLSDTPIIFVRHNGDVGDPDEPGTEGWQVHEQLQAQESDLFIGKRKPSSFEGTPLQEELNRLGITKLIIAGMQTEICVNATTRQAIELGYDVTLASDAHSTFDAETKTAAELIADHNTTLGRLVTTKPVAEIDFTNDNAKWAIRSFDPEVDFHKLLTLRQELEALEPIGNDLSEEELKETMKWHGHDPAKDRWLVSTTDEPSKTIAHAWLFAQSAERVISCICVLPEWRRQGIGSAIHTQIIARAREYGANHLVDGHRAVRESSRHFLLKHGFAPVGNNRFFKAAPDFALSEPVWPDRFQVKPFAEVNDLDLLAKATNRCYHDMWGHAENDPNAVDAARMAKGFRDSPEHFNPASIFLVFGPDGDVAGVCYGKAFKHQEDVAGSGRPKKVIDSPGVVPELRHLGLQWQLVLTTMGWLRDNMGEGPMELWTFGDTDEAVEIYLDMGFTLKPVDHLIEYRLAL